MRKRFLKILCVFFILPLFITGGCNDTEENNNILETNFSADFTATYRDSEYEGRICTNRQGVLSIEIAYPQTIEGLKVQYYSGEMHIMRENLDSSADEAYLPSTSFPSVVKSVVDGINGGKATIVSIDEEECERTLRVTAGNAVIKSRENIIEQIEIKSIDFNINFSNVNLIE